jgi:ABC-type multidrug transport system ATPase subunit
MPQIRKMTDEQKEIVELARPPLTNEAGRIVRTCAGPGSGKTTTMRYLAEELAKHSHAKIFYLTYSKVISFT